MSFMEEGRKKKVEAGREKFVAYQKKKQYMDKGINYRSEYDHESASGLSQYSPNNSSHDFPDIEASNGDNPSVQSVQKSSNTIKHLYQQIKDLQNQLTDKNVLIDSLQVELETVKDISHLNATAGPITNNDSYEQKIAELHHILKTRDAYIENLSENLKQRAQACDAAAQQEKQRLEEIKNLRQKLKDAFHVIENKYGSSYADQQEQISNLQLKVSQMNTNVQDNTSLVNDLKQALEKKDNELQKKEKELQAKTRQFAKQKEVTAKEIHGLMGDVEKLHQMLVSKENELILTKKQMEIVTAQLEEKFAKQIKQMKQELWKHHEEEKEGLGKIHDDILRKCVKNHEIELSQQSMTMATELTTYKVATEAQFASYRECMESLVHRIQDDNKRLQEDYENQLAKYDLELNMCRQQVDNYENKLCEEMRKVEQKCENKLTEQVQKVEMECKCAYESELLKYKCSFDDQSSSTEEEIQKLTHNLKDLASSEARKEVELEMYKHELKKSKDEISELLTKLDKQQVDIKRYEHDLRKSKEHVSELSDKLRLESLQEMELLKELQKYQNVVQEYEGKITDFNVSLQQDLEHVEMKNVNLLKSYEKEIEKLKSALEEESKKNANELLYYANQIKQQHNQLSSLNNVAALINAEQSQVDSEIKSNSLRAAIECSNMLIKRYDNELSTLRQSYIKDITMYKDEVSNLKEDLLKVSVFKQQLIDQMVNHKKDFKNLRNKLCLLISACQQSVPSIDFNSDNVEMTEDGSQNLEKIKYELDVSKSELYEFIDGLKSTLGNIEQGHLISIKKLSLENDEIRSQLSVVQHELEVNKVFYDSKPSLVVVSCQTDISEEIDGKKEDILNQSGELIKQNSELIRQNKQLSDEKEMSEKEMSRLLLEKSIIEDDRQKLLKSVETLTQELTSNKHVENLNKELYNNDSIVPIKQLSKGIATSTPNCSSKTSNNGISSNKYKTSIEELDNQLLKVQLIEECSKLKNENSSLEKQVELLQNNLKEMDYCVNVAHNEVILLETKCKRLQERITEMEHCKRLMASLEQQNVQYKIRNEHLQKDRSILKIDLKVLSENNLYLEKKNNESISKLCEYVSNENTDLDTVEMILALKHKSDEIILLKEKILLDQENQLSMKDKIEEMAFSLNEAHSKFDETRTDLEKTRVELEDAYREHEEIALEKRTLEKELFILKAKLKNTEVRRENSSDYSPWLFKFIKEFQKDLADLKKEYVQEKALMEEISLEKSVREMKQIGFLDVQQVNVLCENNILLSKEKEELVQCIQEQQHMVTMFRSKKVISEELWINIRDVQEKLLVDLKTHLDHHKEIVKILSSVEKCKDAITLLSEQLKDKVQEKLHLEEKLEEKNAILKALMMKVDEIDNSMNQKDDMIQDLHKGKDSLMDKLVTTETKLFETESTKIILERTVRDREVRLKQSQLELRATQLDQNGRGLTLEPVSHSVGSMNVYNELEQQNIAVRAQLQRFHNLQSQQTSLQYSQKFEAMEQHYQDQVNKNT